MSREHGFTPPRPLVTEFSRPYWEGLRRHELVLQQCLSCGGWIHYPRGRCPTCGGTDLAFRPVDPVGIVHTFTITRIPTAPHFSAETPQVIAIVELRNGVRMTTTLIAEEPDAITIGDTVEPVYDDGDDGITMLRYRVVAPA